MASELPSRKGMSLLAVIDAYQHLVLGGGCLLNTVNPFVHICSHNRSHVMAQIILLRTGQHFEFLCPAVIDKLANLQGN